MLVFAHSGLSIALDDASHEEQEAARRVTMSNKGDATRLDDLISRAQSQADRLEKLRVRAARRVTGLDDAG